MTTPWIHRTARVLGAGLGMLALLAAPLPRPALAQDTFPSRPIRLIVPFGPGGGTDILARLAAEQASLQLGQPIAVENRPGGGATVGIVALAQARPDGYTIAICPPICATAPALYSPAPFSPERDLLPVISLADLPLVLVTRKRLGADSMQALFAKARTTAQGLTFASPGSGSSGHLASEMVMRASGSTMVHVPYRSGAAALTDVVAERVDFYVDTVASALEQIRAGAVVPLSVTGTARAPQLPQVPTMAEAGVAGLDHASPRLRIVAPAGTPQAVISRLNAAFRAGLDDPVARARLLENGAAPVGGSPDDSRRELAQEVIAFGRVIRDAGIKPE